MPKTSSSFPPPHQQNTTKFQSSTFCYHPTYIYVLKTLDCWQFDTETLAASSICLWQYTSSFPLTCESKTIIPVQTLDMSKLNMHFFFNRRKVRYADLSPRSNSRFTWSICPSIRLSRISETNNCSTSFSGTLSSCHQTCSASPDRNEMILFKYTRA